MKRCLVVVFMPNEASEERIMTSERGKFKRAA